MYSEHGSFHPSLWEEERKQRQRIHFDFETVEEPVSTALIHNYFYLLQNEYRYVEYYFS